MRFRQAIWATLVVAFMAASSHVGAQLGLGLGAGELSTRIPDAHTGPAVCGGYIGPGDIANGAVVGVAIRAWTASICGARFANITVSGVSADMLTSASTGALVPQTINGSVCPNASTTLCVLTKWYDQTLSNACSGSCDMVKTSTETLGVLTTTCPLPLTACIVFPTSASTFNQAAGNQTYTFPFSTMAFTNYTFGGGGSAAYVGFNDNGSIGHGSSANQSYIGCDVGSFFTATSSDGSWLSHVGQCTSTTQQLFINGVGQGLNSQVPVLAPQAPYVGGIFGSGPVVYETEAGLWNRDISGSSAALNTNQKTFYGIIAAAITFWDSVAGLDTNNCTTALLACQTDNKMKALSFPANAVINWKGGSSFTGCLTISASTGSPGPVTIQQYSTGASPIITSNCGGANVSVSGPKTAALILDSLCGTSIVNGITVRGSGFVAGSATQYGIAVQNSAGGCTPTYLIENVDISGFGVVGLTGSSDQGADIFMGGFTEAIGVPQSQCGKMTVSILNNTLHGSTTTSGENNGFFGTGCGTGYTQTAQGNSIFNISGIASNPGTGNGGYLGQGQTSFVGPTSNSYIKFSLAHDIGGNGTTCGGPVGLWAYQTYGALLTFDEVYNVQGSSGFPGGGACDFSAFDFDIQAVAGLAQYLYGHNTGGPGFVFFQAGLQDVVRYSIFENTGSYNEDGGGAISVASGGGSGSSGFSFQAYNNTIFQNYSPGTSTPPSCLSLGFGASYTGGLWANNVCHNAVQDTFSRTYMVQGNSATGVASITMKNNDYFNAGGTLTTAVSWPSPTNYTLLSDLQAGTSQETGSKIITTGFTAPPTGNCTWTPSSQSPTWPPSGCPAAYSSIAAGLKSAGADLASTDPVWFVAPQPTDAGTRDYYANTIPGSGSCYDMGAYGVCP